MKASDEMPEPKKPSSDQLFFKPSLSDDWIELGPCKITGPLPKIFPPFDYQCGMYIPKGKSEHYRRVDELLKRPPSE